jgi:hypothetical protein
MPKTADHAAVPAAVAALLALPEHGLGGATIRWSAATGTRVDTGGWLGPATLHVALAGDRFVAAAAGPRPFVRVLPAAALGRSTFNHVTGELAVHKAGDLPGLALDPLVARELVARAAAA